MGARLTRRMIAGAVGMLAMGIPSIALADGSGSTETSTTASAVTATTMTSTGSALSTTSTPETSSTSSTATESGAPEVQTQAPQRQTSAPHTSRTQTHSTNTASAHRGGAKAPGTTKGSTNALPPGIAGENGAAPLPFSLRTPVSGLPSLFLEAFEVPAFLLPIYQAAGIAYGVPWQVLAAINEVESDYGRDLNLSSAGAEGWMQFLPMEWKQWGVDAGSSGYMDPYNPADAIFAAARYLSAAGGAAHIRTAIYAYNHSQAYVESVMLRAQLLGSLPPEMLGAVADLSEARFPVHAAAHFDDAFTTGPEGKTLIGTTIYSEPGAPVIAAKDGTVIAIGRSAALGLHVSVRDANGDVFTYANLGEVSSLYPVLAPRDGDGSSTPKAARRTSAAPKQSATEGVQPHPPLSAASVAAGFTFGIAEELNRPSVSSTPAPAGISPTTGHPAPHPSSFLEGPERVYLQALHPGATVIAGTVLGHLTATPDAHLLFQVRPGGNQSPLIDPKPLLDSWVALEDTGIYGAKGESPFLSVSPTAGQALLESRGQLQQQVLRNKGIGLASCERREIEAGRIDRRVLATLEVLSVSGLRPKVQGLRCDVSRAHDGLSGYQRGDAFDITAVNGVSIEGHAGPGDVADLLERKLLDLQGTMKPQQIAGPVSYLGSRDAVSLPASRALVHVAFAPADGSAAGSARIAIAGAPLQGSQWTALDERLAEIPDPGVSQGRSAASVPDPSGAQEGAG
jgi:murein DD-endopeptidase MepM/ murein hydrolase activator NlpD